jgi:hypothetical protein
MKFQPHVRAGVLLAGLSLLTGIAQAIDCSGLPTSFTGTQFTTGNFFSNFNNPCYTIALGMGTGDTYFGDLNATYFQAYFEVNPQYQLIVLGTFPNARYFSVSLYDAHSAPTQSILDANIVPLTSAYINPYEPGTAYVSGQQFAVPINLGGTPGDLQTGCMMNGFNVTVNGLDGTQRHAGMDWNSDAGLFQAYPNFPDHIVDTPQHTNPNTAGVVMVRVYLDITPVSYDTSPHIIVRDVASGCAYPAAYVLDTLQTVVTRSTTTGTSWLDTDQGSAHNNYESNYLPKLCYGPTESQSVIPWMRQQEYINGASPNAAYLIGSVPAGVPATLAAAGEVMRIRFQAPTTPPTPCTVGCSRSGTEQMRYMSLSFLDPGGATMASLADSAFTEDPNGNVTIIVGTGTTIPSWITPANGYTYLDLTAFANYQQLSLLDMRHVIPTGGFNCAGQFVPYRTTAATPAGDLMGAYMPVVDYPVASSLPPVAAPLRGPSACDIFPTGQPGARPNCGVFTTPPPNITGVVTQCPAAGCNQFAAQATPPVTITGENFGNFPNGMPFTGVSNYLEITDSTQNWSAGYTGNTCTVSMTSWATNRIQFVANVNQNGACPLAAGDLLTVQVWNPQTMALATYPVTVTPN